MDAETLRRYAKDAVEKLENGQTVKIAHATAEPSSEHGYLVTARGIRRHYTSADLAARALIQELRKRE